MGTAASIRDVLQQRSVVVEFRKVWESNQCSLAEIKKEAGEAFDLVDFRQLCSYLSVDIAETIIARVGRPPAATVGP